MFGKRHCSTYTLPLSLAVHPQTAPKAWPRSRARSKRDNGRPRGWGRRPRCRSHLSRPLIFSWLTNTDKRALARKRHGDGRLLQATQERRESIKTVVSS